MRRNFGYNHRLIGGRNGGNNCRATYNRNSAVFLLETLPVVALRNHRKASYILVFTVATILLIYKSQEFIRYKIADNGIYPVEFSHISYFVPGVTVVTGSKKMRAFASYCSMLAATLILFYLVNDRYYKYKVKRCAKIGAKYDTTEIGIFPLAERLIGKKKTYKKAEYYNCTAV